MVDIKHMFETITGLKQIPRIQQVVSATSMDLASATMTTGSESKGMNCQLISHDVKRPCHTKHHDHYHYPTNNDDTKVLSTSQQHSTTLDLNFMNRSNQGSSTLPRTSASDLS